MKSKEKTTPKNLWRQGITLTSLGWQLALPIVGGALLGYQLDQSSTNQTIYTFLFILFGIFIGYYNIYKVAELEWLRTIVAKRQSYPEDQSQ